MHSHRGETIHSPTMKTPRSKTLRRRRRASPLSVMIANNLYQQQLEQEAANNHVSAHTTPSGDGCDHHCLTTRTDLAYESSLQAEFAERTAAEMKEILSWWDSPLAQQPTHQQDALPSNSLVQLDDCSSQGDTVETTEETDALHERHESRPCCDADVQDKTSDARWYEEESLCSVPSLAMDSCVSEDSCLSQSIVLRNKVNKQDTAVLSHSPHLIASSDELHVLVREQKYQVDRICSATSLLADCLVALTETSDDDDENDWKVRFRHCDELPLPPLRLQDRIHIWWYCRRKRLQEFLFASIWNFLPLEFLSFWIFLTTYTSEKTRRYVVICLLLLLLPRLLVYGIFTWITSNDNTHTCLVCYKSFSIQTLVQPTAAVLYHFDEDNYIL